MEDSSIEEKSCTRFFNRLSLQAGLTYGALHYSDLDSIELLQVKLEGNEDWPYVEVKFEAKL
jgi:hypothetical protein